MIKLSLNLPTARDVSLRKKMHINTAIHRSSNVNGGVSSRFAVAVSDRPVDTKAH